MGHRVVLGADGWREVSTSPLAEGTRVTASTSNGDQLTGGVIIGFAVKLPGQAAAMTFGADQLRPEATIPCPGCGVVRHPEMDDEHGAIDLCLNPACTYDK